MPSPYQDKIDALIGSGELEQWNTLPNIGIKINVEKVKKLLNGLAQFEDQAALKAYIIKSMHAPMIGEHTEFALMLFYLNTWDDKVAKIPTESNDGNQSKKKVYADNIQKLSEPMGEILNNYQSLKDAQPIGKEATQVKDDNQLINEGIELIKNNEFDKFEKLDISDKIRFMIYDSVSNEFKGITKKIQDNFVNSLINRLKFDKGNLADNLYTTVFNKPFISNHIQMSKATEELDNKSLMELFTAKSEPFKNSHLLSAEDFIDKFGKTDNAAHLRSTLGTVDKINLAQNILNMYNNSDNEDNRKALAEIYNTVVCDPEKAKSLSSKMKDSPIKVIHEIITKHFNGKETVIGEIGATTDGKRLNILERFTLEDIRNCIKKIDESQNTPLQRILDIIDWAQSKITGKSFVDKVSVLPPNTGQTR